jgi:sortase A
MNWQRKLGAFFVLTGAVLFAIYLLPTVYGAAMSHLAVAQFRAQSQANSLWDSARVRAYKRTLAISFAPPEAVLRVPKVGIEVPVLEGTSDAILNRGVGHIPGTALPGQPGNLAITGHRDGFFRPLKDLVPGDIIEVERPAEQHQPSSAPNPRQTDRYAVTNIKIVFPGDTSVLNQTTGSTLTLITCYPFYFVGAAPQRYIVQATLLPTLPVVATQATPTSVQSISGE